MKKRSKIIVATAGIIFTVSFIKSHHTYEPQYEILTEVDDEAFASYQNGLVYIGESDFIDSLDCVNENDILVVDNRKTDQASIKIVSSYRITDKDLRNDILCIIEEYLKLHPDRTRDVDFETNEEDLYDNVVLTKLFNL